MFIRHMYAYALRNLLSSRYPRIYMYIVLAHFKTHRVHAAAAATHISSSYLLFIGRARPPYWNIGGGDCPPCLPSAATPAFIWCIAHKSSLCVYLQIKKQDQPTLPQLIDFPTSADGEGLNITKEIGADYNMFGVLLLNDKCGATISALERQHQNRATSINLEILQQWIRGSGRKPVTWETLVKVLRQIELNILADKIESSLS